MAKRTTKKPATKVGKELSPRELTAPIALLGPTSSSSNASTNKSFVIGGYTDPQGERTEFGALLVGYYESGKLKYAGKVHFRAAKRCG